MLLLLLAWTLLFLASLRLSRLIGTYREDQLFLNFVSGLSAWLLLGHLWSFFLPARFFLLFLLGAVLLEIRDRRHGAFSLKTAQWKETVILLACLFISSLPVWINDDLSYYLQSIKWFSDFGFEEGLAQWNIRLGLGSSWHLLSSFFYWDSITPDRIWNFNGLLLFIFCVDGLRKGISLSGISFAMVLSAPFLNAPSPDLPIILLTGFILLNHKELRMKDWSWLLVLIIGLKATAFSLVLAGCYPLLKYRSSFIRWSLLPVLMGIVWMMKNQVLSGHVLFPLPSSWWPAAYTLPNEMLLAFSRGVLAEIYGVGYSAQDWLNADFSWTERLLALFHLKTYKVIMNALILGSGIYLLFTLRKEKVGRVPFWSVWSLIFLLLWVVLAPNYRFGLGLAIAGIMLMFQQDFSQRILKNFQLPVFGMALAIMVWMNTSGKSNLHLLHCGDSFKVSLAMLISPTPYPVINPDWVNAPHSYYRPESCIYCGDTPTPCVPDTLKIYHEGFGVTPWNHPDPSSSE
ncbi:MAG: hypothetical protein GC180_09200 [Bacteroidetes bacterium]|nr:hypothetical protein [Bacteroidota bacterium]